MLHPQSSLATSKPHCQSVAPSQAILTSPSITQRDDSSLSCLQVVPEYD